MIRVLCYPADGVSEQIEAMFLVLERAGIVVSRAPELLLLEAAVERDRPDALCVITNRPEKNLLLALQQIRKRFLNLSTFLVTPHDRIVDRILALQSGVKNYYIQPFPLTQLIHDLGQVGYQTPLRESAKTIGPFTFIEASALVYYKDDLLVLTFKQARLLIFLLEHSPRPVTRIQIWEAVWGIEAYPLTNSVDSLVRRLRSRVPREIVVMIVRHYGIGYQLVVPE